MNRTNLRYIIRRGKMCKLWCSGVNVCLTLNNVFYIEFMRFITVCYLCFFILILQLTDMFKIIHFISLDAGLIPGKSTPCMNCLSDEPIYRHIHMPMIL